MALLGIRNEQEFYSDYYLEAIFRGDLKEVQARWKQQAPNAPDELALILSETEGIPTSCHIRTARPPATACLVNHDRSHKVPLENHNDSGPLVPLQPFQIREVLLTF